ncbi:hypothetical protein [Propionicimonas sp.]|uniref:hypothetical protein n=1 Tax=Propionicimonas sp. TaxID=1955623 RepID=UPI00182E1ACD|nr:hypothetical protein [Propionicimonas sp.]MBU3977504.1 hypothetical protein [Actinomycetota bacterium]MBA3021430.1 hypothetical protein [Propionicimonas sp.]MBU3986014.1 hypothetical protein [Actinomycetota bacterium]MBU4008799.1 hypothetical protein [Actinomycetota bacterium]MBU4066051.1 hypothetical protein [Actinomycetota bacterium]
MDESEYFAVSVWLSGAAVVVSLVASLFAGLAKRHARRSADEAKRANDRNEAMDRVELNRSIRERLSISSDTQMRYQFVNAGDRAITGLTVIDPKKRLTDLPDRFSDVAIRGGTSEHFRIAGGSESELPEFVLVKWDGLDEAVPIDFPYDPMKSIY